MSAHSMPCSEIARHHARLLAQARRMLRGDVACEDVAQEAMVAALSRLGQFRGDAALSTWLHRIGANTALMNLRSRRRAVARMRRARESMPLDESWLSGALVSASAQAQIERREQMSMIRSAVARLPERYRQIVRLCDLDERSFEDVARTTGLSVGGVRTRRLRAHRMLRAALAPSKG